MYMASFTFFLVHCGSMVSTLVLSSETVSSGIAVVTNTGWYSQVGVFLEAFSKWAFGFTYVHVCKIKVKEAIYIKKSAPSMNREQGYQLLPIYH